jgi:GR25 family glycosyltransferase involved in LPS biosynthesis
MMTLPPTYVISLTRSTDRRERVKAHLDAAGVPFKFFNGFDGAQIGIKSAYAYMRDHPPEYWWTHPPFYVGPGIDGLMVTYLALMKMGLMMDLREFLILEDDVVLCDDFVEKYHKARATLPDDYGTWHLGWDTDARKGAMVSPYLSFGRPLQTHAVLYSRRAMSIVDRRGIMGRPWDVFLFDEVFPDFPSLISWPVQLATQLSATGQCPSTLAGDWVGNK